MDHRQPSPGPAAGPRPIHAAAASPRHGGGAARASRWGGWRGGARGGDTRWVGAAALAVFAADKVSSAIVSTLTKLYGDRSTFKGLAEAAGLHRATHDLPKTWEKVDRLESLLAFDVGTVVAMEGKGVGRVVDANLGLESFKVDFERHRGLVVGFKAAAKLLRPLPPAHGLRRK